MEKENKMVCPKMKECGGTECWHKRDSHAENEGCEYCTENGCPVCVPKEENV